MTFPDANRDLKPENLLLVSDADDANVKLADFGFAKEVWDAYESGSESCISARVDRPTQRHVDTDT